jgi:hypothetical protein
MGSIALTKAAQTDVENLIAGALDIESLVVESDAIEAWIEQNAIEKKTGSA